MPKYVHVKMDKMDKMGFAAPFVVEADTAEVIANEVVIRLGDAVVARFPERSVTRWWIEDSPA